ncbi:hypothetical protein RUND412_002766 [Rhizina undulata]
MDEITIASMSSRTSMTTYHSSASASTYEPRGLSPPPRAPQSSIISFAPGGLPYDENGTLSPITKVPSHPIRASGGGMSGLRVATVNIGAGASARSGTPSSVSATSEITWWSAVSCVPESDDREEEIKSARKTDSGIALGRLPAPLPLPAAAERRESASSASTSSTSSSSTRKSKSRSNESSSLRHRDTPASIQYQSRERPSRHSTASSVSTVRQPRSSNHRLSRSSTSSTTEATIISNNSSSTATHRTQHRLSHAHAPTNSKRSSPSTSPQTPQGHWETTHPGPEAVQHRRQRRKEIEESLEQKYPDDRFKGEFLPFRSEFSHSGDSLCPVRFVKSNDQNIPGSTGIIVRKSPENTPRASSSYADQNAIAATVIDVTGVEVRVPTPRTVFTNELAENYNGPVMGNTVIDWKGDEARRREYEEVDRKRKGLWGCIRRRLLCGSSCGIGGGGKEFWEDGDDDSCSVRRYRLALPEEERKTPVSVEVSGKREDGLKTGVLGNIDTQLANRGVRDVVGEPTQGEMGDGFKPMGRRCNTIGVLEGRGVAAEIRRAGTPVPFRRGVASGRASNPGF